MAMGQGMNRRLSAMLIVCCAVWIRCGTTKPETADKAPGARLRLSLENSQEKKNRCLAFERSQLLEAVGSIIPPPKQVLLVLVDSWRSKRGQLFRLQRQGETWCSSSAAIPITLGHAGLAWGRGLHRQQVSNLKVEGDGKSPAGIFRLGIAFGHAEAAPKKSRWKWLQLKPNHYWVDDPQSPQYNRLVELPPGVDPTKRWRSFERLKASYRYGLVVRHNMPQAVAGAGSAIFLHPWSPPQATTVGCTAMKEEELTRTIGWLDPQKAPILIQLPRSEFERLPALVR